MVLIQQSSSQIPASNHISTFQINSIKSGKFYSHWILDIMVTDHKCYDTNIFFSIHSILLILVFYLMKINSVLISQVQFKSLLYSL